jgi:hypothetical protein
LSRHPGEGRDPIFSAYLLRHPIMDTQQNWVPAFAGTTVLKQTIDHTVVQRTSSNKMSAGPQ